MQVASEPPEPPSAPSTTGLSCVMACCLGVVLGVGFMLLVDWLM